MQSFQTSIDWVENWRHEASNKFLKQLFSLFLIMLLFVSGTVLTGCTSSPVSSSINPVPNSSNVNCRQAGIITICHA